MNLLSCSTLNNWCDDLGKHAIGTAGAVLTLLIHDLFRKHLPLVQLLQQSWHTKLRQAFRLQAYHLPTRCRTSAADESWCYILQSYNSIATGTPCLLCHATAEDDCTVYLALVPQTFSFICSASFSQCHKSSTDTSWVQT